MLQDGIVKMQGVGPLENIVEVKFTGSTALVEGQVLCHDFANGVLDEVKVLTANMPVAGVCTRIYPAVTGGQLIKMHKAPCVCQALCNGGTTDLAIGNFLQADVSDGAFLSLAFTNVVGGAAAIALEAYADAGPALKTVYLTGEISIAVA